MERAKELFLKYNGSRFHMDREGEGGEYGGYHISVETEARWAEEAVLRLLEGELRGKEARRAYSAAAALLGRTGRDGIRERCIRYPLTARHLDDVTVLYMLPCSFRVAEEAAAEHRFPKEDAASCLRELDAYTAGVLERAENGTLSRHADYGMQEFSDPVYVRAYLSGLREKWLGLL